MESAAAKVGRMLAEAMLALRELQRMQQGASDPLESIPSDVDRIDARALAIAITQAETAMLWYEAALKRV